MENIESRFYSLLAMLGLFCALRGIVGPAGGADPAGGQAFPLSIGDWKGERSASVQARYRVDPPEPIHSARYTDGRHMVTMTIVHSHSTKVDFPDPASCNVGKDELLEVTGSRLFRTSTGKEPAAVRANSFVVYARSGTMERFFYFFVTKDYIGNSYVRMRLHHVLGYLKGNESAAALVVVSMPETAGERRSVELADRFLQSVFTHILKLVWEPEAGLRSGT